MYLLDGGATAAEKLLETCLQVGSGSVQKILQYSCQQRLLLFVGTTRVLETKNKPSWPMVFLFTFCSGAHTSLEAFCCSRAEEKKVLLRLKAILCFLLSFPTDTLST
jgi:hypothetical protein